LKTGLPKSGRCSAWMNLRRTTNKSNQTIRYYQTDSRALTRKSRLRLTSCRNR
jgi:hypothetical protein